jgi:hypothetical protein
MTPDSGPLRQGRQRRRRASRYAAIRPVSAVVAVVAAMALVSYFGADLATTAFAQERAAEPVGRSTAAAPSPDSYEQELEARATSATHDSREPLTDETVAGILRSPHAPKPGYPGSDASRRLVTAMIDAIVSHKASLVFDGRLVVDHPLEATPEALASLREYLKPPEPVSLRALVLVGLIVAAGASSLLWAKGRFVPSK